MKALEVDAAVLTVSCPEILRICPDLSPLRGKTSADTLQSLVCVSSFEEAFEPLLHDQHHGQLLPFTGVIEMTNVVDSSYFGAIRSFTFPIPDSGNPLLE